MKIVKLIIAAAIIAALLGSCRSKLCPGYGGQQAMESNNQKTEQQA